MADTSGDTKYSVREATQPRATYQLLASGLLTSSVTNTDAMDTRRYKDAVLFANISQISGTGAKLTFQLAGSVYNDGNWGNMAEFITNSGATGIFTQKMTTSAYLANWTRFTISSATSAGGGLWAQADVNYIR